MSMNQSSSAIEVTDLTVAYQEKPVLWDIDMNVPPGVLMAIVGPNGAGKTTLIKAILGLVRSASGQMLIYGKPYRQQRRIVSYVPQRGSVDWDFPTTVKDVVMMGRYGHMNIFRNPKKIDTETVNSSLNEVGMTDFKKRQIGELSGGQRKKLVIARSLINKPKILIMDEPFSAIDPINIEVIKRIIVNLQNRGISIVISDHSFQNVLSCSDRVCLISDGQIIASGTPKEIVSDEQARKVYFGESY